MNRAEAEYLLVDLLHVSIGSGQNAINATNAHQVTAELDLVPASEGLEVSGRVTGMDGTSTPFRGPPISVSADGRSGNTEFRVSGRGLITVVTEPDISYEAWSPNDLYRSMFASMPGRDTGRGSRWTDTISVAEDNVHGRLEYSRIETSVWDQDTIVAGWLLNVVRTRSEVSLKFQGVLGGFEVDQTLRGISIASVFWHPARRLVYERQETMDLTGRTSIEALGIEGEATVVSRRKTTRLRN